MMVTHSNHFRIVKPDILEKATTKYKDAVSSIPSPGTGCHPYLLTVSNYGAMAGLPPDQVFSDVRKSIPEGRRKVSDREITDAIAKASHGTRPYMPSPKPVIRNGQVTVQRFIDQSDMTEADLWESSPIRLVDKPEKDTALFLESLFGPEDLLWIGDREQPGILGETIRPAKEWIKHFGRGGKTAPHILINPLTGAAAPTRTGDKETFRGDGNVSRFKYCLVEFDNLRREDQIRFWATAKLPIRSLVDSGGKSIHALLDVQNIAKIELLEHWYAQIKAGLYERILAPLGVDKACSNPARLSRLPGHLRGEKGTVQKILWLSPEARPVCR